MNKIFKTGNHKTKPTERMTKMFNEFLYSRELTRYERQLANVNHLVMHTLKEKRIDISEKELETILETLYEYRIID